MDDEQGYRAIKPYGDLGGVFLLDRKSYRIYRIYTVTVAAVAFLIGNWLLLSPTPPADAWPSFWALLALGFYIHYRIVRSGRRQWIDPETPRNKSSGYSIVVFWLQQVAGWFLLIFASYAIWISLSRRGEVHVYEFTLLAIGAASIVGAFASRNRRAK